MKILAAFIAIVSGSSLAAGGKTTTYQTVPNSPIRDYRASAYVTEGSDTYKTLPNSPFRDYRAPTYVTKVDTTYQTLPNSTARDYTAATYRRAH